MDEVRIWSSVRSPAQILAAMEQEIPTATGLMARYGFGEGLGTSVGDSSGTAQNGLTVDGPTWIQGYPFPPTVPNDPPVVDSVVINQAAPHTNDTLSVTVTSHDPNSDPVSYSYQWSRNNVDISGATGATLNMATAGNGGKGDDDPRPCRGQRRPRGQRTRDVYTGHRAQHDPGGVRVDRRHDPRLERRDHGHRDEQRPRR